MPYPHSFPCPATPGYPPFLDTADCLLSSPCCYRPPSPTGVKSILFPHDDMEKNILDITKLIFHFAQFVPCGTRISINETTFYKVNKNDYVFYLSVFFLLKPKTILLKITNFISIWKRLFLLTNRIYPK